MKEREYKNNIAVLRRMRGFSQEFMSKKLGVSRPTYIKIEKGLKELTLSQVYILLETLDVDFDDLLGLASEDSKVKDIDYKRFFAKEVIKHQKAHKIRRQNGRQNS